MRAREQHRQVIATLLRAGRPDLANVVATSKYWTEQYRSLNRLARELQNKIQFLAGENRKIQGDGVIYRNLMAAVKSLNDVQTRVKVIRDGIGLMGDGSGPAVPWAA